MEQRICAVEGCERRAVARGWCKAHYGRWRLKGDPGPATIRRTGTETCEFKGCGRRHEAHGLCPGHYRQRTDGRPLVALEVRRDTTERDHLGRKLCLVCRDWLPVELFFTNPNPKDGLHNRCMRCTRSERLFRGYGVTLAAYEQMLSDQAGGCKICGGTNADGSELSVDHDHSCCPGRKACGHCVRGLLCNRCNMGLGYFNDDAVLLQAALGYLGERSVR